MRELKLKYVIDLVSNLGAKSRAEAKVLQDAQALMQAAITGTSNKFLDWNKLTLLAGKNTAMMKEVITGTTDKFAALDRAISRAGTNTSIERQVGYLQRLSASIDQAKGKAEQLRQAVTHGAGQLAGAAPAIVAGGYAANRVIAGPVKAFATLEEATTALQISLLRKGGKTDSNFGAIKAKAVAMGAALPGTTKDFTSAATELVSLGVPPAAVANGALQSSAYMGLLLKMDQTRAAQTVAKLREAYGLHDDELPAMADEAQRAKFAFGMAPEDLLLGAKYSAGTLNGLGIKGRRSMSEVMTLQGMANLKGVDGSQFGTEFDMMLTRLAKGPLLIAEAKKGMKAEARQLLDSAGVNFEFYDAKGSLKTEDGSPIKGILRELEKLKFVKDKLGDKAASEVTTSLFGQEASRLVNILADAGVGGFTKGREAVAAQASLEERIAVASTTLAWKLEALAGTVENVQARMATQLGNSSKAKVDWTNDVLGGPVDKFFEQHPAAGTAGIVGGGVAAGVAGVGAWSMVRRMLATRVAAVAGAEVAGAAGEAGGLASTGLAAGAGAGAAGLFAGYEVFNLISALTQLYGAKTRDAVTLTPDAQARIAQMSAGGTGSRVDDAALARALGLPTPMGATQPDVLTLTQPGQAAATLPVGRTTEVKLGEGKIDVNVHVFDDRATATTAVTQQPSAVRLSSGNTNPAGYKQ